MCSLYISYTIGTTVCYKKFYLLLFWSRHVYADLAMHATLAALGTLPRSVPVSPWAQSICKFPDRLVGGSDSAFVSTAATDLKFYRNPAIHLP